MSTPDNARLAELPPITDAEWLEIRRSNILAESKPDGAQPVADGVLTPPPAPTDDGGAA